MKGTFHIPDISITSHRSHNQQCSSTSHNNSPFTGKDQDVVSVSVEGHNHTAAVQQSANHLKSTKGKTHELESIVSVVILVKFVVSQSIICRSDIFENWRKPNLISSHRRRHSNSTYAGRDDSIPISEPNDTGTLDPAMAVRNLDRLRSSTWIEESDLLVPRGLQCVRYVRGDIEIEREEERTVARRLPV